MHCAYFDGRNVHLTVRALEDGRRKRCKRDNDHCIVCILHKSMENSNAYSLPSYVYHRWAQTPYFLMHIIKWHLVNAQINNWIVKAGDRFLQDIKTLIFLVSHSVDYFGFLLVRSVNFIAFI